LIDNRTEKVERFPFTKEPIPYIRLHIYYNILVMRFNGSSIGEILTWVNDEDDHSKPQYKSIIGVIQQKKDVHDEWIDNVFSSTQAITRVLRKGEKIIFNVSKGIFPSIKC
jgi:hypothetical protein